MSALFRKLPASVAAISCLTSASENRRCWPLPPRSLGFTLAALRMVSKVDALKLPAASFAWLTSSDLVHPSGLATGRQSSGELAAGVAVLSGSNPRWTQMPLSAIATCCADS